MDSIFNQAKYIIETFNFFMKKSSFCFMKKATSLAERITLKTIYKLHERNGAMVSTSASRVPLGQCGIRCSFIKKMAEKLISYRRSQGN